MHREASALATLETSGIPRLIESNSEYFDDLNVELYLVEELIDGPTLEEVIKSNLLNSTDALTLFEKLLLIIKYCHENGIVHRDIKPDNIVLRHKSIEEPVIIDFGQSFNLTADEDSPVTWDGQHLGNRFLILPELHGPQTYQRDLRTDLSQLCGILFYTITGEMPGPLAWEGIRPHQRKKEREIIRAQDRSDLLMGIFDRAFQEPLDQRWQSAETLIEKLTNDSQNGHTLSRESVVRSLQERLRSRQDIDQKVNIESQFNQMFNHIVVAAKHTAQQVLENAFVNTQSGRNIDMTNLVGYDEIGLVSRFDKSVQFTPRFEMRATGTEFILTVSADGSPSRTLFREPIVGFRLPPNLIDEIKTYFLNGVERLDW